MNLPLPKLVTYLFKRMCILHCFNCTQLFATLGTVVHQAPLSMGFSPCPSPGDLPNPGIELKPLMSSTLTGQFFTTSAT